MTQTLTPRAESNGELPWYVRAVKELGPLTAIVLFLVWFITLGPGNPGLVVKQIEHNLIEHQQSMSAHIASTEADRRELRVYLKAICINTATNENQRAICAAQ